MNKVVLTCNAAFIEFANFFFNGESSEINRKEILKSIYKFDYDDYLKLMTANIPLYNIIICPSLSYLEESVFMRNFNNEFKRKKNNIIQRLMQEYMILVCKYKWENTQLDFHLFFFKLY